MSAFSTRAALSFMMLHPPPPYDASMAMGMMRCQHVVDVARNSFFGIGIHKIKTDFFIWKKADLWIGRDDKTDSGLL